jgi:hypothetical protein
MPALFSPTPDAVLYGGWRVAGRDSVTVGWADRFTSYNYLFVARADTSVGLPTHETDLIVAGRVPREVLVRVSRVGCSDD